jgi:hypothetical protein
MLLLLFFLLFESAETKKATAGVFYELTEEITYITYIIAEKKKKNVYMMVKWEEDEEAEEWRGL